VVSGVFGKTDRRLTLRRAKTTYPFGLYRWRTDQDECIHGKEKIQLNLTPCNEQSFNCNDGTCIDLGKRCDLNIDCPDSSDEMNCTFLEKPSWYLTDVSPPKNKGSEVNEISVNITMYNILHVDVVESRIETQFQLKLSWFDSRLKFRGLKEMEHKNWVTKDENIWKPQIRFHNTENKATTLDDSKSWTTIQKLGSSKISPYTSLENMQHFEGSENKLTQTRTYNVNFICIYDLTWYPLDSQVCYMNISLLRQEDQFTLKLLKPELVNYTGPKDLLEYGFKSISVSDAVFADGMEGVSVKIIFKRNIFSHFMTVYVPTVLIILVSYLTTFFNNQKWFGHIITINLTAMLVMTTMLTSIVGNLPTTADIKFIDFWMLFCLTIPVLEIVLHTVEDHFIRKEKADAEELSGSRRVSDTFLSVNMRTIKILPADSLEVDKESIGEMEKDGAATENNLTQLVLKFIETISNVVILLYIIAFTTIYWVIGLFNYS